KLREHVLSELSPEERSALHRRVAQAIERAYPNAPERDTALAHHWRAAQEPTRELHYQERSAAQALAGGADPAAIARFTRALELIGDAKGDELTSAAGASRLARLINPLARTRTNASRMRRGVIEAGITEAYYRLGDLRACEEHASLALTAFGLTVPRGRVGLVTATLREAVVRLAQHAAG